jgi:hypothetical protein
MKARKYEDTKNIYFVLPIFRVSMIIFFRSNNETFEKCSILFKFKEGEYFNRMNTFSILRIKLKLHCVQNVEPDTEIGQKGAFCKGLKL